ncbi:MAG: alpha-xylosidase, partial [Bacteroidetes bacterium]
GGDAETSDMGMEAQLRGGLSLGLSGFSFWSHDIGGFTRRTPEELYRRWLPFGALSSHTRCHGQPPKEPWDYGTDFEDYFRRVMEMKYQLMPYVYAQAKMASEQGLPMVRALFVEYPDDPGAWLVDDAYLFGADILVAPLFEGGQTARDVYLPGGEWVDYQTGQTYGPGWQRIAAGDIEAIILVKAGTVLPTLAVAQSTDEMDWSQVTLTVYGSNIEAKGWFFAPGDEAMTPLILQRRGKSWRLQREGLPEGVRFSLLP